ncbi:MAG: hypothetical protein J7J93_02940 [Candidatus Aenigmarchaeota archaeon]|nr:hypothetical protein [Candidatus Aenigmarchaeota archaeon]
MEFNSIIKSLISQIPLLVSVAVNIWLLIEKFQKKFSGNVIFKTTYIWPNPEEKTYPMCIIPKRMVPITISPKEEKIEPGGEVSNRCAQIEFTITNNYQENVLIEKIRVILVRYEEIPDKCIITQGPLLTLMPFKLWVNLVPFQKIYELLRENIIEIPSKETEYFKLVITAEKTGIYTFKIEIHCRIKGKKEKVIESDILYSVALPDSNKCKKVDLHEIYEKYLEHLPSLEDVKRGIYLESFKKREIFWQTLKNNPNNWVIKELQRAVEKPFSEFQKSVKNLLSGEFLTKNQNNN